MSTAACASPLEWDLLLAYWLGELDPEREAPVEEHYLGCARCSARLQRLQRLARGIRTVARRSGVGTIISERFARRLVADDMQVREYRVPRNGAVNCTVAPGDDFVVAYMEAPLDRVERVDLVSLDNHGAEGTRQADVPFIADSGAVVFAPGIEFLRRLPQTTLRMRLLAVDDRGERILGDYAFHHTPQRAGD